MQNKWKECWKLASLVGAFIGASILFIAILLFSCIPALVAMPGVLVAVCYEGVLPKDSKYAWIGKTWSPFKRMHAWYCQTVLGAEPIDM